MFVKCSVGWVIDKNHLEFNRGIGEALAGTITLDKTVNSC